MTTRQKILPKFVSFLMERSAAISVTNDALSQIKSLLANRGKESFGIRVGVKSGGCSGLTYYIEYADSQNKFDEVIEPEKNIRILIDPKALMYLIGSQMGYSKTQFRSGFVFTNPNEKGQCGCGKSFNV